MGWEKEDKDDNFTVFDDDYKGLGPNIHEGLVLEGNVTYDLLNRKVTPATTHLQRSIRKLVKEHQSSILHTCNSQSVDGEPERYSSLDSPHSCLTSSILGQKVSSQLLRL